MKVELSSREMTNLRYLLRQQKKSQEAMLLGYSISSLSYYLIMKSIKEIEETIGKLSGDFKGE